MKSFQNKKKNFTVSVVLCSFFLFGIFTNTTLAANRFWVGPLNGLTSIISNWSLTSGGSGGAPVPTIYDTVNFSSGTNNASVNANMTVGDFIMDDGSGIVTIADGVTLTIGSATGMPPRVTVGKSGTQISTTTADAQDQDLGGGFLFSAEGNTVDISTIKIKQVGSFPTGSISNIRLSYKDAVGGQCSATKPSGTTDFGIAGSFDTNKVASTTGSSPISLTTDTPVCVYIVYDLSGTPGIETMGRTIDFEITNPSTDVITNLGTVMPNSKININGVTMIGADNTEAINNVTPTTSNPACSNDIVYSFISIRTVDEAKNPTKFYLQNCAVWKQVGDNAPYRLTNTNLQVHSLVFTDMTQANNAGAMQISMTMSNMDPGQESTFMNVTKTLRTTGVIMAWPRAE